MHVGGIYPGEEHLIGTEQAIFPFFFFSLLFPFVSDKKNPQNVFFLGPFTGKNLKFVNYTETSLGWNQILGFFFFQI